MRYNNRMNILSVPGQGLIYTVIIFLFCVIAVHGVLLAKIGYKSLHKKIPPEKPKEEKTKSPQKPKPEKDPEPVYFIVEKKKKRAKSEYSAPREIKFK